MPKSLEKWREVSPEDRAEIIKAIGKALTNAKIELAQLMTDEMGKTLVQSRQEVGLCVAICQCTAEIGPNELETEERDMVNGKKGHVSYAHIGIVYGIQL